MPLTADETALIDAYANHLYLMRQSDQPLSADEQSWIDAYARGEAPLPPMEFTPGER